MSACKVEEMAFKLFQNEMRDRSKNPYKVNLDGIFFGENILNKSERKASRARAMQVNLEYVGGILAKAVKFSTVIRLLCLEKLTRRPIFLRKQILPIRLLWNVPHRQEGKVFKVKNSVASL